MYRAHIRCHTLNHKSGLGIGCVRAPNLCSHKEASLVGATADNQCDGSAASPQRMVKEQTPKGSIPSGNGNEKLIP